MKSGERVGIGKRWEMLHTMVSIHQILPVGRTGSGKVRALLRKLLIYAANSLCQSSLTLALLRCIITEGKVYYDGLPTDSINLDALRSSITIIPQVVRVNAWT